jgi:hypothetical protein
MGCHQAYVNEQAGRCFTGVDDRRVLDVIFLDLAIAWRVCAEVRRVATWLEPPAIVRVGGMKAAEAINCRGLTPDSGCRVGFFPIPGMAPQPMCSSEGN